MFYAQALIEDDNKNKALLILILLISLRLRKYGDFIIQKNGGPKLTSSKRRQANKIAIRYLIPTSTDNIICQEL